MDSRGFTLPEVMITIVILGILFAIASSTWQSVVEGRQVDSATNQLASDLRLAHSKATNQLTNYTVSFAADGRSYRIGQSSVLESSRPQRTLPDDAKVNTSLTAIEFKPDGSVTGPTGVANEIVVSKMVPATNPKHGISINPTTSRIKVD